MTLPVLDILLIWNHINACMINIAQTQKYNICPFVTDILCSLFSRLIHVVACIRILFILWFNTIPLYRYAEFCFSIHPLMDNLGCFHLLTIVSSAAVDTGRQGSESLFSVLWGVHLGMELLDHMVIVCLDSVMLPNFCIASVQFYIPNSNVPGFWFLHILAHTCYFSFFFFF